MIGFANYIECKRVSNIDSIQRIPYNRVTIDYILAEKGEKASAGQHAKMRRERRSPFEVSVDPFYSDTNMAYLKKILSEIDSGRARLAEHELIED